MPAKPIQFNFIFLDFIVYIYIYSCVGACFIHTCEAVEMYCYLTHLMSIIFLKRIAFSFFNQGCGYSPIVAGHLLSMCEALV